MAETAITNWLALALVSVTAVYAWVTFRILRANEALVAEMKEQRDSEVRPYVVVWVEIRTETNLIYLFVKNVGRSAAENLRLSIDRNFYQDGNKAGGRNIRSWAAFANPIEDFPPGTQLQFLLGTGPGLLEQAEPLLTVSAEYSFRGKPLTPEQTRVDLRPFDMSGIPHDPVVEELQRVRESIDKAANKVASAIESLPTGAGRLVTGPVASVQQPMQ